MTISFSVRGEPKPKGSMKALMPRGARRPIVTHDNKGTKPWQIEVGWAAAEHAPRKPWEGAVRLKLTFFMPRPKSIPKRVVEHTKKPDLDKLARLVGDALKGIVYADDSQVVSIAAYKVYAVGWTGVEIEATHLGG